MHHQRQDSTYYGPLLYQTWTTCMHLLGATELGYTANTYHGHKYINSGVPTVRRNILMGSLLD